MLMFAVFLVSAYTAAAAPTSGIYVGDLKTFQHNTKGSVYVLDEKTIVVKNFQYDGTAPGDNVVIRYRVKHRLWTEQARLTVQWDIL